MMNGDKEDEKDLHFLVLSSGAELVLQRKEDAKARSVSARGILTKEMSR